MRTRTDELSTMNCFWSLTLLKSWYCTRTACPGVKARFDPIAGRLSAQILKWAD